MSYSPTYSASRLDTFDSCHLKYDLVYKRGYFAEENQQNVLTRKGNAFHKLAETYDPTWSPEELLRRRLALETEFSLPEEFSLEKPLARFIKFFDETLAACLLQGGKVYREIELKFKVNESNFTGKLDVLLAHPNGTFTIIDYKTGKSANPSYYTSQMMLYVWAISQEYKIPLDEVEKRIQVGLFFPMANPEEEDYNKVFKKIKFTKAAVEKELKYFTDLIYTIEKTRWEAEANINRMCDFCPFIGQKKFCPISAQAGLVPVRGTVIKQKEWAIQQGIK